MQNATKGKREKRKGKITFRVSHSFVFNGNSTRGGKSDLKMDEKRELYKCASCYLIKLRVHQIAFYRFHSLLGCKSVQAGNLNRTFLFQTNHVGLVL